MTTSEISSSAECGCRVYVVDDEVHVRACSREHEPVLERAARQLAEQHGIPVEVIEE